MQHVDTSRGSNSLTCGVAWPDSSPSVKAVLQRGRRQVIVASYNGSRSQRYIVYWVTPKVAHTKIAKLLRRPPFHPVKMTANEERVLNAQSMLDVGNECLGTASCAASSRLLRDFLSREPFEFTFWRDPLGHLVSAAAQATHCLNTHWCIRRELPWPLNTASHVSELLRHTMLDDIPLPIQPARSDDASMHKRRREVQTCHPHGRCTSSMPRGMHGSRVVFLKCNSRDRQKGNDTLRRCMRHLYPQSAGYGWHASGLRRLHFVGRMERFIDDWRRLLLMLGEPTERAGRFGTSSSWERRVVNRRSDLAAALAVGGGEYARLVAQDGRSSVVGALLREERCWNRTLL